MISANTLFIFGFLSLEHHFKHEENHTQVVANMKAYYLEIFCPRQGRKSEAQQQ